MAKREVTKHIDYMSVTFFDNPGPNNVFPLLEWVRTREGFNGDKHLHIDRITGAMFGSGGNPDNGTHLTMAGGALSAFRQHFNCSDDELMLEINRQKGRASRLDLTINVHGGRITPNSASEAFEAGRLKSTAIKGILLHGVAAKRTGDTFEIGSRKSDRYARIYDKAAEMGIVDGTAWVRFEMELKRMQAHAVQWEIVRSTVEDTINGQFLAFIDWQHPEYLAAIAGRAVDVAEIGRKDTNTEKWLLDSVAKALAKVSYLHPEFRMKFNALVDYHINQIEHEALGT